MSNYDQWNTEKKRIDGTTSPTFYLNEREIWNTSMGKNIGFEEDGKGGFLRPVIVLKKVGSLYFTVALTSRPKTGRFYFPLNNTTYSNSHNARAHSSAILSQVKVMDKKRFQYKMGTVAEPEFIQLKKKLTTFLL